MSEARRTAPVRTDKTDAPASDDYDVVVVGGGASGLAAAVFTARYGLDTVVLDRGVSAIRRCYAVENYPGFLGIDPESFLSLARGHVRYEGGEVVDRHVRRVEREDGAFRVRTDGDDGDEGAALRADYVVAATAYDADYLAGLRDGEFHGEGDHPVDADEATGRTDVDGLYVAGWLSGDPHQVVISAGHGARVAKSLVRDHRVNEEGFWEEVAQFWDWCVEEGTYGGEDWEAHVGEWIDERIPEDRDLDEDRIAAVRRAIKEERRDIQTPAAERAERLRDARALLDEVVSEEIPEPTSPDAE